MTPGALRRALDAQDIDWPDDAGELATSVEARADTRPGVATWTSLVLAVELYRTAEVPLPAGYRRDRLVRFDALSATWTARDPTGDRFLIRAPRADASAVERRLLLRDSGALQGLVAHRIEEGAVVASAPGAALDAVAIGWAPVLLGGLNQIEGWMARGFAPAAPDPEEVRIVEGRARLVSLTPGRADVRGWVLPVARMLHARAPAPVLAGLLTLPPQSREEAVERVRKAMHAELAERAVDLRTRSLSAGTLDRRGRLIGAVQRLRAALPAPEGRAAVGFDLNAHPTSVESDSDGIRFAGETLFADRTFVAPAARRFLRACANAPVHDARHAEGTDPELTESISRWVACGLKLRTVHMLLERT